MTDETGAVPEIAHEWWLSTMTALCDVHAKYRNRADENLAAAQKQAEAVFGSSFLSPDVAQNFSVKKAKAGLKALLNFKKYLSWQIISKKDQELISGDIDLKASGAAQKICLVWDGLTENGKKMLYCQMMIGWLVRLVEAKTGKSVLAGMNEGDMEEQNQKGCEYKFVDH